MRLRITLAALLAVALAGPAFAHSISGTVYCDQNNSGTIDPGDTGISVFIRITSLVANPGDSFLVGANVDGTYSAGLIQQTDQYRVEPTQLPAGFTVVSPAQGFSVVDIISGTPQDTATGVDFLLQGCSEATTTTTTSTTTTSTTTTTTTTSTTTTTLPECAVCPFNPPFLVARDARLNNDATIDGSVGVNDPGGSLRMGRRLFMTDGTTATSDGARLAAGASIANARVNNLVLGPNATVRGTTGPAVLPIISPFCSVPAITCGGPDVQVSPGQSRGPIAPGVYGRLWVLDGASVTLEPGVFTFCEIKTGRSARITTLGQATLNVDGRVTIGTASILGPAQGTDPIIVNATGRAVRVSDGAIATAVFTAPNARISFGRGATLQGCFCADRANSDKRINLTCP